MTAGTIVAVHYPQAYHITFGTFLARPPGSERPHVDRHHNGYRQSLAPADPAREQRSREIAAGKAIRLTVEQRKTTEEAIRDLAGRDGWRIYAIAPMTDHVHVVLGAPRAGEQLRDAVKAAATKALNKRFGKRTWWAAGGSAKYLWERDYFLNAVSYVEGQQLS